MYNEALAMLDKNTVDYMIERQQKEIERLKEESLAHKDEIEQYKKNWSNLVNYYL